MIATITFDFLLSMDHRAALAVVLVVFHCRCWGTVLHVGHHSTAAARKRTGRGKFHHKNKVPREAGMSPVSEVESDVDSAVLMRQQGKLASTWKATAAAKLLAGQRGTSAIRIPAWLGLTIKNPVRVRVMSRIVNRFDSGRVLLRLESQEKGDTPCIRTSCRQLAGEIGCDPKTVKLALNWLQARDYITMRRTSRTRRGGWLIVRLGKACPDELRVGREAYVKDWIHLAVGKNAAMSWLLSQLLYYEGRPGGVERDGKHWRVSSPGQFERKWGMERSVVRRALERLKKLGVIEVAYYPYKPRQSRQALTSHIRVVPEKLKELLVATRRAIDAIRRSKREEFDLEMKISNKCGNGEIRPIVEEIRPIDAEIRPIDEEIRPTTYKNL